jgi:1,4-dihydroxy-6-naphthoate synthase
MKLAISTCPNDTFAFHAILQRKIDLQGLELELELLDIEQLNEGLVKGRFDLAKASFHAAMRLSDSTIILPTGSALGFGVGPLLLSAQPNQQPHQPVPRPTTTLCPGELTTATLLFKIFYSDALQQNWTRLDQVVFSEIMPALQNGRADFGVCIHEGRFTWQAQGLNLVEDLGARWEKLTGQPLPLGGLLARRNIPKEKLRRAQTVIRNSIEYGLAHREETLPTMRQYAQEFSDEVLFQHVDLYVNSWTLELGAAGRQSLACLYDFARRSNAISSNCKPLVVLE